MITCELVLLNLNALNFYSPAAKFARAMRYFIGRESEIKRDVTIGIND